MLDPLYHLAANAIVFFHKGFGPIFGRESFVSWALSIILLVVVVRILIFPLFVKQVKSQRTMQMLQPRIKEIREKYKNDKPRMQTEIMQLQKEHGNPLLGCLPILLQIPLFIALFHVFNAIAPRSRPGGGYQLVPTVGLTLDQVKQIANAKLFGVSLSSAFTSPRGALDLLGADGTAVKITAVALILLMSATTFLTQKQIMSRTGPVDPQQERIQKILLYVSPVMLAVFGFRFPIAVLLYWLTTNLWSMGQQFFVIRKMPPVVPLGPSGRLPASGPGTGKPAGKPVAPGKQITPGKPAAPGKGEARPPVPKLAKSTPPAPSTPGAPATAAEGEGDVGGDGRARGPGGAADADGGRGGRQVTPGGGGGRGRQQPQPAPDGVPRPPAPSVAAAGARRPPGGSRPTKRRGKGQRRGGRH